MRQRLIALVFPLLLASAAQAHDFWIEPSTFGAAAGEVVTLQLRVGEHFKGDTIAIRPARIERFFARSASGEREIGGNGAVVVDGSGAMIVGYHGRPSHVELAASKFEQYLREEGLESIIALRATRGESERPGREIFSRCAKAILAGDDRAIGLRLEIVRRENDFSVTFEGRPLAGSLVVAMRRGAAHEPLRGRTDDTGIVTFPPLERGVWLVKTVHMVPAGADATEAEWESIWASEIFEIR